MKIITFSVLANETAVWESDDNYFLTGVTGGIPAGTVVSFDPMMTRAAFGSLFGFVSVAYDQMMLYCDGGLYNPRNLKIEVLKGQRIFVATDNATTLLQITLEPNDTQNGERN